MIWSLFLLIGNFLSGVIFGIYLPLVSVDETKRNFTTSLRWQVLIRFWGKHWARYVSQLFSFSEEPWKLFNHMKSNIINTKLLFKAIYSNICFYSYFWQKLLCRVILLKHIHLPCVEYGKIRVYMYKYKRFPWPFVLY